jgi:polysaccharide deacetylase family protein (PEP-CTERM system associated)
VIHALSIELEEWYHADFLCPHVPTSERRSQVEEAVRPILDLLRRAQVRATFFTVGEVARDHPDLMRELVDGGHEIGCHTMTHRNLQNLTEAAFREELDLYRATLAEVLPGYQVIGFRAPTLSLNQRTHWALGVLRDAGYHYDSSVMPVRTPVYGVAGAPLAIYHASLANPAVVDESSGFLEFPVAVSDIGPLRVPVSGGIYLRLLPYSVFRLLLRRAARRRPCVIYIHPWETYVGTHAYPLPIIKRVGTYTNIRYGLTRLERLLDEFSFAPVREVLRV